MYLAVNFFVKLSICCISSRDLVLGFARGIGVLVLLQMAVGCSLQHPDHKHHRRQGGESSWQPSEKELAERAAASSYLSQIETRLARSDSPMTLSELAADLSIPQVGLRWSLDYVAVSPAKLLWEYNHPIDLDVSFFKQQLMGYITFQGSQSLKSQEPSDPNFYMRSHVPLVIKHKENSLIEVYLDYSSHNEYHDFPPVPALKIWLAPSSVDADSYDMRVSESGMLPLSSIFSGSNNTWIRSVRAARNPFIEEDYVTVEFAVTQRDKIHNLSFTMFPHRPTKRGYNPDSVWKVLPTLHKNWVSNHLLQKGLELVPLGFSPQKPVPWYLVVQNPQLYEGTVGQMLMDAVGHGIESWNIYGRNGRRFVDFHGLLPPGVKVGDHGYSFVSLPRADLRQTFPTAYVTMAYDGRSGDISSALVHIPTAWVDANAFASRYVRADGTLRTLVTPEDVPQSSVAHSEEEALQETLSSLGFNRLEEHASLVSMGSAHYRTLRSLYEMIPDSAPREEDPMLMWQEHPEFLHYQLGFFRGVVHHEVGHALGLAHNFKGSMVSYEELPTSIMDYLLAPTYMGLFAQGMLQEPLSYDQAFMDVFYNEVADDEAVPVLPTCSDSHVLTLRQYSLYDVAEEKIFSGIDPFCEASDIFHSVKEGMRFMEDRLTKDVTVSGFRVPSFVSRFRAKKPDEQAPLPGSAAHQEKQEGGAEEASAGGGHAHEHPHDLIQEREETQEEERSSPDIEGSSNESVLFALERQNIVDNFSRSVKDYFYRRPPSFFDIIKSNNYRLVSWMPYAELLDSHRWSHYEKGLMSAEGTFKRFYQIYGLVRSFRDHSLGDDLRQKSGLFQFSYALEYDIHSAAERTLLLGLFEDVLRLAALDDGFKVFPTPLRLAEITCDLEDVIMYFPHQSACLEVLAPEAWRTMSGLGEEFVESYIAFLSKLRELRQAEQDAASFPLVRGYLSSDVIKQLLELLLERYDFKEAILTGNPLQSVSLEKVLELTWNLLDRPATMDYAAVNALKAQMKANITSLLQQRYEQIDEELGEKGNEKKLRVLFAEKRLLLKAIKMYAGLPEEMVADDDVRADEPQVTDLDTESGEDSGDKISVNVGEM